MARRADGSAAAGAAVLVGVFTEEEARWVRERGGTPVPFSEASAERLLEWYDRSRG